MPSMNTYISVVKRVNMLYLRADYRNQHINTVLKPDRMPKLHAGIRPIAEEMVDLICKGKSIDIIWFVLTKKKRAFYCEVELHARTSNKLILPAISVQINDAILYTETHEKYDCASETHSLCFRNTQSAFQKHTVCVSETHSLCINHINESLCVQYRVQLPSMRSAWTEVSGYARMAINVIEAGDLMYI
ncbi:MAG: hypothetical protein KatS3mg045_1919 [Bellilinea sp.]|nr:MAG: hypothetical protein KatS3mg045_1919 [Bellilinea sp.]